MQSLIKPCSGRYGAAGVIGAKGWTIEILRVIIEKSEIVERCLTYLTMINALEAINLGEISTYRDAVIEGY